MYNSPTMDPCGPDETVPVRVLLFKYGRSGSLSGGADGVWKVSSFGMYRDEALSSF